MSIKAVIFDLDGTITEPYFDFDAIRDEMGLDRNSGPVLETMQRMSSQDVPLLTFLLTTSETVYSSLLNLQFCGSRNENIGHRFDKGIQFFVKG